jgi:hypothetical protein
MRYIETEDLISGSHTFVRDKSCTEHNHNLDTVDAMKRPETLKTHDLGVRNLFVRQNILKKSG